MAKKQNTAGTVINQIIIKAPQRKTSDVGEWRNALTSADSGRMKRLFDLYEDLLIDSYLSDAYAKRREAVTNAEITFQDAKGQEVPEMVALMDTIGFEDLLNLILDVRFWGRSAMEFDFTEGISVFEIPKKHIDLINRQILKQDTDITGIPYEGDDNLLVLGKPRDFGLFLKTAPYVIWKRGGFGDWAQWLEIFGMPQRVGKYSSFDPQSRLLLEQALENAGSAPWLVIPKESDVETVNNTGSGSSGTSFNDFRKACNEEILITVLGQTLTTIQGDKGARSLGEVHKEVEENKNRSDMRFVQRVLNQFVLPRLENRGFPVKGGRFVFPEAAEQLSVSDIVGLSDIIDIPASYLHDKFSIPVPKDGEQIARRQMPQISMPDDEIDDKTDDEPVKNSDMNLIKKLASFFVQAPAVTGAISTGSLLTLSDDDLHDRLIKRVAEKNIGRFDPELFNWISKDLISALYAKPQRMADLGFTYGYQSDAFRTAQELNVFHFSAAKTLVEIQRLNELYRQSKSFDEFYKSSSEELNVFNKTWQQTEWQTATLITESTENYNRLKNKTKLFPYWEYRTVGDDKVREEHRKLHGLTLPASDPRWNKIWPPNGWKCRCHVVPRMRQEAEDVDFDEMRSKVDEYYNTKEWKQNEAQGFGVNRALMPEIFNENQMYIKKFPNQAAKLLKDINYSSYGLKSYEQMRSNAQGKLPVYDGAIKDFVDALKKEDGKTFFTDYNSRSILFDEQDYLKGHSKEKYEARAKYFKAMSETLKTPDEVWINSGVSGINTFDQYVFLKYYEDETMAVIGAIENGIVYKINTWFPVSEVQKTTNKMKRLANKYKYRWGLLIKKPGV
ncbi:MAG: phage portal protein family protein [Bacteroidota bacterium]